MTFKDITKKIKRSFVRKENIDIVRNPERDWRRLLVGFVACFIIVVCVDGYLFYKISKGDLFSAPPPQPTSDAVDRDALQRVAAYYASRQAGLNAVEATPPSVPDPSSLQSPAPAK
jgi:hypothetical protein